MDALQRVVSQWVIPVCFLLFLDNVPWGKGFGQIVIQLL